MGGKSVAAEIPYVVQYQRQEVDEWTIKIKIRNNFCFGYRLRFGKSLLPGQRMTSGPSTARLSTSLQKACGSERKQKIKYQKEIRKDYSEIPSQISKLKRWTIQSRPVHCIWNVHLFFISKEFSLRDLFSSVELQSYAIAMSNYRFCHDLLYFI